MHAHEMTGRALALRFVIALRLVAGEAERSRLGEHCRDRAGVARRAPFVRRAIMSGASGRVAGGAITLRQMMVRVTGGAANDGFPLGAGDVALAALQDTMTIVLETQRARDDRVLLRRHPHGDADWARSGQRLRVAGCAR